MTTSGFDPEISNANLNAAQYYIDDDGALKFVSPYISSSNFDGTIPVVETTINAENIEPGMLLQVDAGEYLPVISVSYDDVDLESSPSSTITIGYVDSNNELNTIEYNFTDSVDVRYEDWANKDLGNQGWSITSGGNAIFANVGVRGDLEATTLDVGGDTGITYDGTSVVIGASVVINAPVTFNGSGSFVTLDYLSSSYALQSFVDTVNTRLSSSISTLNINASTLSASMDFLYNAGFVTDTDLVTNGATVINGNNITTGTIDANQVNISSGLTGLRGIKVNSLGLTAYNSSGSQTFNINSNTGVVTIGAVTADQLATDSELSSGLGGKIDNGGAATDVNSNITTISGGKIRTGILESTGFSGVTDGTAFSTTGMAVNLDNGSITAKSFRIDTGGNAVFSGSVVARGGYFGNSSYGMGIVDDGSTVTIRSTTLRMGSQNVSGTLHGSIDFYTASGSSIGQISSAASNKTWAGLGDGIILGTTSDYFFLPRSGNTTRSRYYGSGFEWYNTSGQTIMSIAGGTGGLRINTGGGLTGNGITSSNANIEVTGTGKFVGDGSGLTNLPGGGGGGVTEIKFGDNQLWRSGRVYISSGSVVSAIDPGAIGNGKLANSTIQIMSTTKSLGQSFVAGDIDGDVLTANSVSPGKIANTLNLFSIGGTGVVRGATVSTITGPLTIGNPATGNALTVNGGLNNGLSVPTARGLDYTMNFGTSLVSLNRASTAMTLTGVTVDGLSLNTALFTLGSTAITAGNTVANFGLNYNWYLGTTAISLGRANAAATLTGITLSGAKITTPPTGATSQNFLRWNSGTNDITQTSSNTPPSSIRFKEIIQRNPFLETSWIDEIEIVTFKYNQEKEWYGDNAPERLGLIAEEIENIPSINKTVEYNNVSGLAEGIDYDKIALLLIPEIKLLRQRVADLEARLDAAGL